MAIPLSAEDMTALAAYLAALPPPAPKIELSALKGADIKKGSNLYRGHCGACHGSQAEGNPALNAPGLAWLDVAYMARQYRNFQQGLRGRHPDDTYGRQMQAIASNPLTEQDLNNVIAYMRTLATE